MRGWKSTLLAAAILMIGTVGTTFAQDVTLDQLSLGDHWYGENYTVEDLKGRVVVLEIWGYN